MSWNDAVQYCNWLSRQEGLTPAYTVSGSSVTWNKGASGYRLPTEVEREYACRAGTTTPFLTGSNVTTNQANYSGNYPYNGNAKGIYHEKTWAVERLKQPGGAKRSAGETGKEAQSRRLCRPRARARAMLIGKIPNLPPYAKRVGHPASNELTPYVKRYAKIHLAFCRKLMQVWHLPLFRQSEP